MTDSYKKFLPLFFEPHGLYGTNILEPDEPWPYGYLSRGGPNKVPCPIFELHVFLEYEVAELNGFTSFLVRAANSHDELIEAVEAALGMVESGNIPNWDWLRQVLARARCD